MAFRFARLLAIATAGAAALAASPCIAGRSTYTMDVSVDVTDACTITAMPLIFLVPVPVNANVDSTSTVTVRCTPLVPFVIEIDRGLHSQGNNRRVYNTSANDYVFYDIYKDPPRSQIWGRGNTQQVAGNSGLTGLVVYPVYGRLNAKTSMKAGAYQDTVTLTINF